MPKVRQYGAQKVATEVTQGPRARGMSFNDGIGQGLQNLGQGLVQMQERVDLAAAEEAALEFEKAKNNLFFNPDNGYFNSQGRDAYDRAPVVTKELESLREQFAKELPSPKAREAYNKVANRHILRSQADVAQHASKGIQAWEVGTLNAQTENALENAALYWNNDESLRVQRALGRQAIIDAGTMEGVSPEVQAERLQTYESSFAKTAIKSATAHGAAKGKELLKQMKDRLEGPDLQDVEVAIARQEKAEKTAADSQLAVLKATNLVSTYAAADNARGAIIEQVNAIEDPDLRKETMREAMYQLEQRQKADSEERGKIYEAAESYIMEPASGGLTVFKAEHSEAWDKLTPQQQRKLESGGTLETDYVKFSELMQLSDIQLAKINPADHFGYLAPTERKQLVNAVNSARNGGSEHQAGRSRTAETTAMLEQLLGERRDWSKKKTEQANAFYRALDAELQVRQEVKGRKLDSTEYSQMLQDMTRKVVLKDAGFAWFDKEMDITDIPAEDIDVLNQHLRDNGVPLTAENLIKAYRQASE